MKHALSYTAGIIGLAIGLISSNGFAQTTANGPYYATPSWDQTLPANTRFIVLTNFNNEAVLDRETGLVWQRAPTNTLWQYSDSDGGCVSQTIGGKSGWRGPSVYELLTLVDRTQANPALPLGHPFLNVVNGAGRFNYWTTTPYSHIPGSTAPWVIGFDDGAMGTASPSNFYRLWCVRGPGGAQPAQ